MSINAWLALGCVAIILLSPLILLTSPLWGLWLWRQARAGRAAGYRALLPGMARTARHYTRAVIRADLDETQAEQVARNLDRYIASTPGPRIWRLKLMLVLMEYAPLLRLRLPFRWLSPVAREQFLDRHMAHASGLLRVIAMGRQLVRLGYYASPAPQTSMGFMPVGKRRQPKIPHPVLKTRDAVA
jgi:hypothetical protein